MKQIKKPNWDKRENNMRGVTGQRNAAFFAVDESIKKDMTITAKYKGRNINMKVISEISPDKFTAKIFDMGTNSMEYKGLSLDDIVEINKDFICWHKR